MEEKLHKKLCIVGNSVTLRVRPRVKNEDKKVYSSILQNLLPDNWKVLKYGKSRYLSSELLNNIDKFLKHEANVYVLNIGCVDAPPREIPKWYSDIIFKRKWLKLYSIFNGLYRIITTLRLRKYLVYLRKSKPWISKDDFFENMSQSIEKIKATTDSDIIIIGINKGSSRLEQHLPGILKSYANYDVVLKNLCSKYNLKFLDVSDLNPIDHFPDGVHYNELGHKIITKRIIENLNE